MTEKRKDLKKYLELQRKVMNAQLEVDATPNKGVKADWDEFFSLSLLENKSLETKKPIIHFLNSTMFDVDLLMSVFRKVAEILPSTYRDEKGLRNIMNSLDTGKIDFLKLIEAVLREDEQDIISCSGIKPSLLLFLINASIQCFVEEVTRRVSPSLYNQWWQTHCPICGRIPTVARIRNRRRYLMCNFCGAEYLSDYFVCVYCGNKDPYTLKYIKIDGKPEFQIDFCEKCNHYIKTIVESALREPIPRCVEDILTLDLDIKAKNAGLIRI